jgi:hypothetical protein
MIPSRLPPLIAGPQKSASFNLGNHPKKCGSSKSIRKSSTKLQFGGMHFIEINWSPFVKSRTFVPFKRSSNFGFSAAAYVCRSLSSEIMIFLREAAILALCSSERIRPAEELAFGCMLYSGLPLSRIYCSRNKTRSLEASGT